METMVKRGLSLLLACMLVSLLAPVAFAADGDYSIRVQSGKVNFLQGEQTVGSYAAANTNLLLTSDRSGEVFVQFPNSKGTYTNITLGQQRNLIITGTMNSLTLGSALPADLSLTLDENSKVNTLQIYSTNPVSAGGTAALIDIQGAAAITLPTGANASRVCLRSAQATLKADGEVTVLEKAAGAKITGEGALKVTPILSSASTDWARSNSGLMIDSSSTSASNSFASGAQTTTTQSGLTIKASAIDAVYGDYLDDLEGDLDNAVRVYNRSGTRIYGDLSWTADGSTRVRDSQYYRFSFWPDDDRYDEVIGRVKVVVDEESDNRGTKVYFETQEIHVTGSDDLRLSDLTSDLNANVSAFSTTNDSMLDGVYRWVSSSARVRATGYHQFTFTPYNTRYPKTTGRVRVYVD